AFRTTLQSVDGLPVQVIAPELKLTLTPIALQSFPEAERYAEALRLTTEDFARPFDLARGPLVRVGLLQLAEDDHVLYVNMHHTITDRWSGAVFEKELVILYQAFAMGQPSPLPELPIQFADYAVWQRERMNSEIYQKELAYWKKKLSGAPFIIDFPTDYPRPPIQNFNGERVYVNYAKSLLDGLKELSRREGVTMFMTLMAAYNILLYRYTRQEDILVSAPIGNRIRPETENIVGYLLNLLILRTDLSGNPTFRELLKQEQEICIGAFAHQELPFGKLVQELKPKQDPSRNPIAQVAFLYLDFPETTSMEFLGLTARHIDIDNGASRFDITLSMTETSEGFTVCLEYITDLFSRDRMERMAKHLEVLLEAIIANPDARISQLPLLSREEERQLRDEWHDTATTFPQTSLMPDLFESHAERQPEATALLWEDERISYGALNHRANQFARHLQSLGVGTEVKVGVLLERSPELVAALLGTLKAGGVYLPLDPQYPRERLGFMMEDAGVSVLITHAGLYEQLPPHQAGIVDLETSRGRIEQEGIENLKLRIDPEQAAYIIYTSGSTGRPKGVVVEHRQLLNTLQAGQAALNFMSDDCMPCLAPFSFDISLFELLIPLITGGRCLLASGREVLDASAASKVLKEATVIHAVPSLMRRLIGLAVENRAEQHARLRQLLVGGDAVPPELIEEMHQAIPSAQVTVLYGPTEAAMVCASSSVAREQKLLHQLVGRPMSNTVIRLLDQQGNLVPVGIDGELCIGGASVARGYLNRLELTAQKFAPDPFSKDASARLYRTGDLGRYLSDGTIIFTGRSDEQVKVRGFRIELGEIESALKEHEGIRECIALTREDTPGDKRLIAYLVAATPEGSTLNTSELRGFLKARVPEYMLPSAFVFLEQLPLTPNGKVDKKALPAPDLERPELETAFVPPETPTEQRLAVIWTGLLGINRVGLFDNYFELGGDSLLATRLASQIRKVFEVELPLKDLFQHPTLAELSAIIEEAVMTQMEEMSDEEVEESLQGGF
ncbi:MAG: amino acid adenylation domain-containing protein, partial [Pyrinomonadaceae bacterium]|nr:amino acid adenylation domain-containing protein [Pyrinomonadaceae bacterium]